VYVLTANTIINIDVKIFSVHKHKTIYVSIRLYNKLRHKNEPMNICIVYALIFCTRFSPALSHYKQEIMLIKIDLFKKQHISFTGVENGTVRLFQGSF
jgi:hypothetical protein